MPITKEVLDKAVAEMKEGCSEIKAALNSRGPFKILAAIIKAVPSVVEHVEKIGKALGIKGADKKKFALDIIMVLIGPKLPWWAKWIPIRAILGAAIDMIVELLNKKLGKKWGK